MGARLRPWLVVVALTGCASTVGDTAIDAGAGAPSHGCRWRAGTPFLYSPPGGDSLTWCAEAAPEGAWLATNNEIRHTAIFDQHTLWIARFNDEAYQIAPFVRILGWSGEPVAPLAIDTEIDRRAVLQYGERFVRLGRDAEVLGTTALSGLPAVGRSPWLTRWVADLKVNRRGFTSVAIRQDVATGQQALSLLQLDEGGAVLGVRDLGLAASSLLGFLRVALADRDFMLAWFEGTSADGAALMLRRYDENGAAISHEAHLLDAHPSPNTPLSIVPWGDGLIAFWETLAGVASDCPSIAWRRLDAEGRPTSEQRTFTGPFLCGTGLDATLSHGTILVSEWYYQREVRFAVMTFDPERGVLGAPIFSRPEGMYRPPGAPTRLVTTRVGALAFFEPGSPPDMPGFRGLAVVAMTCQ